MNTGTPNAAITTLRGKELSEQSDYRQMLYELRSWVDDAPQMAAHLRRIREEKLFRHGGYKSFDAFCKAELGHNRDWAYKVIAAGESQECIACDTKPANQRQAQELAKAKREERAEIWEAVVEEAEATGEKITAKKVAEKINERQGGTPSRKQTRKELIDAYYAFVKVIKRNGLSGTFSKLLQQIQREIESV